MKIWRHTKQLVVLKKDLRMVTIDKISKDGDHYLISYFTEYNNIIYDIVMESDILSEAEYDKIKNRTNKINKLFK